MKLSVIETGFFKLDGGAMFGVVPKVIWKKLNPADADNLCTWAMRCLLIEDGKKLILIDCGMGEKQSEKFFSYYKPHGDDDLIKSIRNAGYHEDEVTDVILTHLHFDHCGGAVKRDGELLVTAFKNAIYWTDQAQWDWALTPNPREKASFLRENLIPIEEAGQLKFLSEKDDDFEKINFLRTYGHTEAMVIPKIKYKDHTICYMADLLPAKWHVPMPYIMAYDIRPFSTLDEKAKFLKQALDNNYTLFFEHDPLTQCGNLKLENDRIKFDQGFGLDQLW